MKKNDIITLEITDITNLGFGVGKYDGAVIFTPSLVPGDVAEVKIIKAASSYYVGRTENIIKYSDMREADRCDNTRCRSCAYRVIGYENELKIKENTVRSAFLKEGLSDIRVLPTVPSPKLTNYRNKAQYPLSRDKNGHISIGFYAPKSHNVCEAASCIMSPEIFCNILEALRLIFEKRGISVYDEESGKGLLRHIYLRRSESTSEVLVTIVINGTSLPYSGEIVSSLTKDFPDICGILLNINRKSTNVILGDEYVTLFGKNYIVDTLAGVDLKITAPSFYQVNHGTATLIYEEARRLAALEKSDTLLDLFCGAGSIGLSMASECRELIGIEIVDDAVKCAKENAKNNGIENAKFYTGDAKNAEDLLKNAESARREKILPDVVILDPPRAGSDKELLEFISKLSPKRIVYISCNPTTLARDVAIMKNYGYVTNEVKPYDMFPMTGHVESVVCLTRRLDN